MALNEKERKSSATFGGDRFPMPDVKHARLALQMLPRAKDINSSEEGKVRARATRMLGAKKALSR
jgi:hypothetical protein